MEGVRGIVRRVFTLTQALQRILLIELAKALPQRREARSEKLRRAKEVLGKHRKALGGISCGVGINAGRTLANQVYFILNVFHRRVQVVLPARDVAQRDHRHAAGAIAVAGIQLVRHFVNNQVEA